MPDVSEDTSPRNRMLEPGCRPAESAAKRNTSCHSGRLRKHSRQLHDVRRQAHGLPLAGSKRPGVDREKRRQVSRIHRGSRSRHPKLRIPKGCPTPPPLWTDRVQKPMLRTTTTEIQHPVLPPTSLPQPLQVPLIGGIGSKSAYRSPVYAHPWNVPSKDTQCEAPFDLGLLAVHRPSKRKPSPRRSYSAHPTAGAGGEGEQRHGTWLPLYIGYRLDAIHHRKPH